MDKVMKIRTLEVGLFHPLVLSDSSAWFYFILVLIKLLLFVNSLNSFY